MAIRMNIQRYYQEIIGFSLFLIWEYCALFGCTLVQHSPLHNSIEYVWLACAALQAAAAFAGLGLLKTGRPIRFRPLCIVGGTALPTATICIRIAFSTGQAELFWTMGAVGGALAGVGCAAGIVAWGSVLKRRGEAGIEFIVAASFFVSFVCYCCLLLLKNCTANALLLSLCAAASFATARRMAGKHVPDAKEGHEKRTAFLVIKGATRKSGEEDMRPAFALRTLAPVVVLIAVLWMQIAYFRVLETPDYPSTRFLHYLVPFSFSAAAAAGLIALCLNRSRYLNMTLMFRWQLPFLLISCGILYLAPLDQHVRSAAFTFDFLGMFGLQFGYWVGAAKQARRAQGSSTGLFLGIALGKGLGIAAGSAFSLWLAKSTPLDATAPISILLCACTLLVCMVVGFNPNWLMGKATDPASESEEAQARGPETTRDQIDNLFSQQAQMLAGEYGLTKRETEIAAMLLAGRSRPYIRDALFISLNTVHTHAKNILMKCGVHSQQELMDLARSHAA